MRLAPKPSGFAWSEGANVIKLRKSSKLWAAIKFWYRFELLEYPNFFIG